MTADGEHGPSDDITGDNMVFSGDSSTSGLQLIAGIGCLLRNV